MATVVQEIARTCIRRTRNVRGADRNRLAAEFFYGAATAVVATGALANEDAHKLLNLALLVATCGYGQVEEMAK